MLCESAGALNAVQELTVSWEDPNASELGDEVPSPQTADVHGCFGEKVISWIWGKEWKLPPESRRNPPLDII